MTTTRILIIEVGICMNIFDLSVSIAFVSGASLNLFFFSFCACPTN